MIMNKKYRKWLNTAMIVVSILVVLSMVLMTTATMFLK